ncbi:MAG TPA: L-threonylcarbamoyladenylate synthase [Burkholderiaceae bacterium]|nr:L-threonylcarbamoyladenylate synthase [Burkholderiaceae bacterium]
MTKYFAVHAKNPQLRLLQQTARILAEGGIAAIPTDSCYALACHLDDKPAVDRIRRLRKIDERHQLSLLCRDLSEIAAYARVDNVAYRMLRQATPGPYTFILEATREVPRRLSHPSRKTIGIRVPDHVVALQLLHALGQPLIGSSLLLPGDALPLNDVEEIRDRLDGELDVVLDAGGCGVETTTVIDLSAPVPTVVRVGRGRLEPLGLA